MKVVLDKDEKVLSKRINEQKQIYQELKEDNFKFKNYRPEEIIAESGKIFDVH